MSDSAFDPTPAVGIGAELFNQPALFYLTHQPIIEEWAGLSITAAEATHQWLSSAVRHGLTGLAAEAGMELSAVAGPNYWQHLLLHPPETPTVNDEPIIGIGLCWHVRKVNPRSYLPFVGVRASPTSQGASATAVFLNSGGEQLRHDHHLQGKGEATWPAYFYLPSVERWWEDLDSYRSQVLEQVERGLTLMQAPFRVALRALGTGG